MKKETFNVPQIFFYQLLCYECNFLINLLLGMVHKMYDDILKCVLIHDFQKIYVRTGGSSKCIT